MSTAEIEHPVVAPGGRVTVEARVANVGSQDVGDFDAAFFLVDGTEFTVPRAEWRLLERETLGGLDAGAADDESEQFTVPADVAPGGYTLVLVLDDRNLIVERREIDNEWFFGLTVTGTVAGEGPAEFAGLSLAASPNPASGAVTLSYSLAAAGLVRLAVYDALGREVAVVVDGARAAGTHETALDTSRLPAGVYLVRLDADDTVITRQLTVLR